MSERLTKKKNLLIVDHSFFIIDRIEGILTEAKAVERIFTATDFEDAVKSLQENEIDIVLMDFGLTGKTGITLLKFIAGHYPETKIVVLSNQVSGYYQKLCKDLGASFFIDKSKDFDQIPKIVASI
jgi:DNA-binding NarL/FixJ family response regulator